MLEAVTTDLVSHQPEARSTTPADYPIFRSGGPSQNSSSSHTLGSRFREYYCYHWTKGWNCFVNKRI